MSAMTIGAVDSNAAVRVAQSLANPTLSSPAVRPGFRTVSASAGTSGTTTAPATGGITSNDFLSLLVTEMKNQDPTQPTDPNAYIQQLVGVNSLQQLISINQDLSKLNPGSGSGTSPAPGNQASSPI